jgi:hypothetical protein
MKNNTNKLYPSFMLHDFDAKKLNLNQEQIEQLVSTKDETTQRLYQLHYIDGYNRDYISKELGLTKSQIQGKLNKLKLDAIELAKFFNNDITLIIGRSGTGKSTIEKKLCDTYNVKTIKSYTTRPPRSVDDDTHIFIDDSDYDKLEPKIATTTINGVRYFATLDQFNESKIYVIDPRGMYELINNMPDKQFNLLYLNISKEQHQAQLKNRRQSSDETKESQRERLESENEQFSSFEEKLKNKEFPSNVHIIKKNTII